MQKINKILFPTDFSEPAQNAFRYALILADKVKAEIELLHVVIPQIEAYDVPVIAMHSTQVQVDTAKEVMKTFVDAGITQMLQQLSEIPKITSSVEVGVPIGYITRAIEESTIDLVVMGATGERNVLERMIGSLTSDVIGKVDCPVLVVPNEAIPKLIKAIAYATDLQKSDPFEIWKTVKLLDPIQAIMHVVHVSKAENQVDEIEEMDEMRAFFAEKSPAIQMKFHQTTGESVEDGLINFVDLYDIDIVVMFHPNRSFMDRLFHRSHSKKMAKNTKVPLLVLK